MIWSAKWTRTICQLHSNLSVPLLEWTCGRGFTGEFLSNIELYVSTCHKYYVSWAYVIMVCHEYVSWTHVILVCHEYVSWRYVMLVCHEYMSWTYVMSVPISSLHRASRNLEVTWLVQWCFVPQVTCSNPGVTIFSEDWWYVMVVYHGDMSWVYVILVYHGTM